MRDVYLPEEEDEFLSRLSVVEFVLGVEHSIATLTLLLRLLQVFHEIIVRRTYSQQSLTKSNAIISPTS